MPEVIDVKPKGVYVKIECSLEELIKLKDAMDHCDISVDLKDPKQKAFHSYFVNEFYGFITKTIEGIKHGFGPDITDR